MNKRVMRITDNLVKSWDVGTRDTKCTRGSPPVMRCLTVVHGETERSSESHDEALLGGIIISGELSRVELAPADAKDN